MTTSRERAHAYAINKYAILNTGVTVIYVSLGYVFPRTHIPRDMCSPEHISLGICVPPKGYMFPRRSDMRSPGICVPPPARASTGQTLASAGRDGSPRGRTRPSALAAGTSQPHVCIACTIWGRTSPLHACSACRRLASMIHGPRRLTTGPNYPYTI